MSIYPKVTQQDLFNLHKLAKQQKNQRAPKFKSRKLEQSHDIKLAESLSPKTKKVEEVNVSTQNIGEVIEESKSENNQEVVPIEFE